MRNVEALYYLNVNSTVLYILFHRALLLSSMVPLPAFHVHMGRGVQSVEHIGVRVIFNCTVTFIIGMNVTDIVLNDLGANINTMCT